MAVDTARKRLSMLKRAGGSIPNRVFVPTGTVDAQARAVLLGLYGGNAFDSPFAPGGISLVNMVQSIAQPIVRLVAPAVTNILRRKASSTITAFSSAFSSAFGNT